MERLLFFGDSITDMGRVRNVDHAMTYGMGYVFLITTYLKEKYASQYEIINQGISGNTILDLYERYQQDVIAYNPNVLTIFVGVNDVWHRINNEHSRGSKLPQFEKLYETMIVDIKRKLPNTKIILCEPYMTHGIATDNNGQYEKFMEVFKYAKKVKKIAKKYQLSYVKLQKKLSLGQEKYGRDCLYDGIHPNVVGASIIKKEWLKCFLKINNK